MGSQAQGWTFIYSVCHFFFLFSFSVFVLRWAWRRRCFLSHCCTELELQLGFRSFVVAAGLHSFLVVCLSVGRGRGSDGGGVGVKFRKRGWRRGGGEL